MLQSIVARSASPSTFPGAPRKRLRPIVASVAVLVACIALMGAALAQPQAREVGFVEVEDGVRVYFERYGSGTPTVFIPNRLEMNATFAPILASFDVVTWDPRGRGLSDRPSDLSRYGLQYELADLGVLLDRFEAEAVTYVGISLWANIAVLAAAEHPERVTRVVALSPLAIRATMMGPPADPPTHDLSGMAAHRDELRSQADADPYDLCSLNKTLDFAGSYANLGNMDRFYDANVCRYPNEHNRSILPIIDTMFASFGEWDWRNRAKEVEAPVLLMYGSKENWALDGVRAYAEWLPNVGSMEIEGAGHHIWNDAYDVVMPRLRTFLGGDWPDDVVR